MELALDERLMVQKHLIKMAVDCGESLEDARTQAKAEIGEAWNRHLKTVDFGSRGCMPQPFGLRLG